MCECAAYNFNSLDQFMVARWWRGVSMKTQVNQKRVGKSLQGVGPEYHQRRQNDTARQMNQILYIAIYYRHKLHIDQNEKLGMYAVTHVCAIDGYSKYIITWFSHDVCEEQSHHIWKPMQVHWLLHVYIACNLRH